MRRNSYSIAIRPTVINTQYTTQNTTQKDLIIIHKNFNISLNFKSELI